MARTPRGTRAQAGAVPTARLTARPARGGAHETRFPIAHSAAATHLPRAGITWQTPLVEPGQVLTLVLGAAFGAFGWLVVGLFIARRQFERQAKSAARAVYFELDVNRINVELARDHGVFQALVRSSFDRLLPELSMWLSVAELRTVTKAYMSHAGYEQVQRDTTIPAPVRSALLARTAQAHVAALAVLSGRAFSSQEVAAMVAADGPSTGVARESGTPAASRR